MLEIQDVEKLVVDKRNNLNDLTSKEWIQETKSFFFQKGLGTNNPETKYEKMHPAPFSFTDISKLIRFFSKEGDKILDPFLGVGSTIKACLELNREGFGVELSQKWVDISRQRLLEESGFIIDDTHLICGDSRKLKDLFPKDTFDFIITSPPYWNILEKKDHKANERVINGHATKYSENELDLGNIGDYNKFLDEVSSIFMNCYDILKPGKYLNIIVSDFRHKSEFVAFHADLITKLTNKKNKKRFNLQGIKILIQNAKKLYPYGYPFCYVENIHHQYILIFQKGK